MLTHIFKRFKQHADNKQLVSQSSLELAKVHAYEEHAEHMTFSEQQSDMDHDIRNAMWFYLRAALRGDKEAQYKMGLSYLNGQLGLDRSYVHAEKWLDQAAHQGHPEARIELHKAFDTLACS